LIMVKGNSFHTHWCTNWQWDTAEMECAGKGTNVCSVGERLKEAEYVTTIFQWQQICLMLVCLLMLFVARFFYRIPYCFLLTEAKCQDALNDEDKKHKKATADLRQSQEFKVGDKLMTENNTAVGISFAGYLAAMMMVLMACIGDLEQGEDITSAKWTASGSSESFSDWSQDEWNSTQGENVWGTLIFAFMGILMLTIARMINDLITTGVDEAINIAVHRENASGILEASSYLSTGLILSSSLSGRSVSWGIDMSASWIYFAIGQILYLANVLKFTLLSRYDDFDEINKNNAAVAVAVGGQVLSNAVIVSYAIYIDTSLVLVGTAFGIGIVVNYLSRKFADCCLLPGAELVDEVEKDKNWGAALVAASAQIAAALMIMSLPATLCDNLNNTNLGDALTNTDAFDRVFKYYQLFLMALIPLMLMLPRWLYPLGLKLSGGVPDLDFLKDDELDIEDGSVCSSETARTPLPAADANSAPAPSSGTGSGLDASEVEMSGIKPDTEAEEPSGTKEQEFAKSVGAAPSVKDTQAHPKTGGVDIDDLLTHQDNKSIALSFSGYILGIALMFRGTVSASVSDFGPDYEFKDEMADLCPTLMLLTMGTLCLVVCHIINDKVIIPNVRNIAALDANAKHTAVGVVEAGSFIATGKILGAASYGYVDVDESSQWGEAIFFQLFWFLMGQFAMVAVSEIANKITGAHAKLEVQKQNKAAGIFLASRLITGATIVSNPIGSSDSVVTFFVMLPLGMVFTQICKYSFRVSLALGSYMSESKAEGQGLYNIIVVGKPFKKDKNWANAIVEGVVLISGAAVFGSFLRGCDCYAEWSQQLA